ncbi:MAG: beta-lactamase family protein, partial [Saprospiraceae bacterium]|nr:beta-lactamase family protein [Saprospiraceae bacterium]
RPDPGTGADYSDHPKNAKYVGELSAYQAATGAPGAILLVSRQGEPLWIGAGGHSNLEHQTAMRTNTPFRTGSITKMFVATAILQLRSQNKLTLGDVLTEHLPEVSGKIPLAGQITVRHLLGHLSGITDPPNESIRYQLDIINGPDRFGTMPVKTLLEKYVYHKALNFNPGTAYGYSNANYWLLGLIIERLTQKNLQQALDELIFSPLGLTHTWIEKRDDRNVARGYADFYGSGNLLDVSSWDRAEGDGKAAGGLISTAEDLTKFMKALFGGQLLPLSAVEEMKQIQLPHCSSPDCEYGLGLELWRTGAGVAYGHNGSLAGIEANVLYFPESGNVVLLFKNNGNGSDKRLIDRVME